MAKTAAAPQAQTQTQTTEKPANGKSHEEVGRPVIEALLRKEFTFKPFLQEEPLTLTPQSVMRFIATKTKSGHECTVEQATKFCMLCKARGLNPWEGDAFLTGYDTKDGPQFSLITAYQAFLKRAEVHPEFDGFECGITVRRKLADADGNVSTQTLDLDGEILEPSDNLIGAWARVHRKNRKIPAYRRVNLAAFDKGYSRWNADKAGMIVKCAAAKALRESFPNALGGMYIAGEMPEGEQPTEAAEEKSALANRIAANFPIPVAQTNGSASAESQQPTEEVDEAGPVPPVGSMADWNQNNPAK